MNSTSSTPSDAPPKSPSSRLGRFLRGFLILTASLVTIWALACAIENLRAALAWRKCQAELAAKGEKLRYQELIIPAIPDDQNFAATPLWKGLLDIDYTPGITNRFRDTNSLQRAENLSLVLREPGQKKGWVTEPSMGRRAHADRCDFTGWQAAFRKDTNYPAYPSATTPARDILKAMERFEPDLAEIREGAKRPSSRFNLDYEQGFQTMLPHLARMKGLSRIFSLRALALLEEGRTDEAMSEVQIGFRLAEASGSDGLIISALVAIALDAITLQPVWEGTITHHWSEPQLARLQEQLLTIRHLPRITQSFRMERAIVNLTMDKCMRARNPLAAMQQFGDIDDQGNSANQRSFTESIGSLAPSGWIRQNQVRLNDGYQNLIEHAPDLDRVGQRFDPESFSAAELEVVQQGFLPYRIFARALFPAVTKMLTKAVTIETEFRCAATGIALERYRLAEGHHPDTLQALVPRYLKAIPIDPFTGAPLKYIRKPDGSRVVYSVGTDLKDNEGVGYRPNAKGVNTNRDTDLVWIIPAN